MSSRCLTPLVALLSTLLVTPVLAQPSPAPTAYTVVEVTQLAGPKATTVITYRDGPTAVQDYPDTHVRNFYDLASGRNYGWSITDADPQCSSGTFSGDWGDPFQSGGLVGEMAKLNPTQGGVEFVNGIRANVLVADDPQSGTKIRLWVDTTYGELVKWVGAGADKKIGTLLEVKTLTLAKPAHAIFALPKSCAKLASQPPPPTEAQRIAALTGSASGTYVTAITGPASKEACAVQFSVVQPKTLAPIPSAYRVAIDPAYDADHPASYSIGQDIMNPSKPFFSGGGLREVTDKIQNGVVRLPDPASMFTMELAFGGDAGFGSATIYRQCGGKSTARLLYVLKNAAKPSDGGDWVWGK